MIDTIKKTIEEQYNQAEDKVGFLNEIKSFIHNLSPFVGMPVNNVQWVPISKVHPNDYNPNSVAKNEMRLLYVSIEHDGYTQPIVTVYDKEQDMYVIVDGFHRYLVATHYKDIQEKNQGMVPIVVLDKDINDRMASTIRHNRARGKHSIQGVSDMVFKMLRNGWSDEAICNEIGLEPDELIRLKHITGFSKLFENVEYGKAWETDNQIKLKKDYERRHK